MRRALLVLLALPLGALLPTAASADPVWVKSGSFLAGSPVGDQLANACRAPSGANEGVDSNCFAIPPGFGGFPYRLTGSAAAGAPALKVCFYGAGQLLACNPTLVPAEADRAAVSASASAQVRWTLEVY